MIELIENDITVEEYLELRAKVNWKLLAYDQAKKALANSLFYVKAVDTETGEICGMGRIVGDGAVICYVQDLIVVPQYQGQYIGSKIIERLKDFANELKMEDTTLMFCLMCAKGREPFYEKHGFIARPTENLGPGMIMYLS